MIAYHGQNRGQCISVCDQPAGLRRLICAGAEIAQQYGVPVKVVSVLPQGLVSAKTAETLQTLYNISGKLGAEMTVYFNDDAALTAAVHARKTNAVHIVSGAPGADSNLFIETVKGLLPEIPMSIVDEDAHIVTFPALRAASTPLNR